MEEIQQAYNINNFINNLDKNKLQQMIFIYNALENGWQIKKTKQNLYSFKKPHYNQSDYFSDKFISTFIKENIDIKNLVFSLSKEIE